jgi:hypothetical protein
MTFAEEQSERPNSAWNMDILGDNIMATMVSSADMSRMRSFIAADTQNPDLMASWRP